MAGDLTETAIGDVCQVFDGPHATPTRLNSGPIFLGITSLKMGRIDLSTSDHVSEEDFVKWTRRITPRPGDVVFSYETKLGDAAIIPEGLRCCLGRRMGLMRPDPMKLDSRFLLYYYLGPEFQDVIRERTIRGSTVDRIALLEFPKFPLRLPPLPEQKAIAAILGALDDKIELNRRMNATLESMARALFQSWFVDFDPVRAKADGRQPSGLDADTAALFPDSFESSDIGTIPKGWQRYNLREIADILSGGTPKKDNKSLWQGDIPWISPKSMTHIHVEDSDEHVSVAAIGNGTRQVPNGTTLVMVRGMGLHQGVRISQAQRDVTFNQDVKAIVAKSIPSTLLFYGCLHAAPMLLSKVHSSGHGTGVLSTEFLDGLEFVMPPKVICEHLTEPLIALNSRISANSRQSRILAALRDSLLPKLLSGEVRVVP